MNPQKFELGTKALITDPCYPRHTWCAGVVDTRPGKWVGTVLMEGRVCATLLTYHENSVVDIDDPRFEQLKQSDGSYIDVGVDSGQAGIFCDSIYPHGDTGDSCDMDSFYGKACNETNGVTRWGVLDRGIVSSSGYGDGGYNAYGIKDIDNRLIAIKIVFVEYNSESEEEPEDEELWDQPSGEPEED